MVSMMYWSSNSCLTAAVVTFDVGVLLGLAGFDVLDSEAQFLSPYQ